MLNFTKKSEIKNAIATEKELISSYKNYELGMKETIETYLSEFKNVCFDNDTFKTMLVNNFENATTQLDNNLTDIESVENVLDILASQKDISKTDVDTYNKLSEKTRKDIELTQNFMQKTVNCFENISISGKKKSITVLEECKDIILGEFPFAKEVVPEVKQEKPQKKIEANTKAIKKSFDYASSDLLCFFPKEKDDNLVLSTVQDNYKISFTGATANIFIEKENFNISLKTPGVQISNSNTNNILFVSHTDDKYTIITNNQIEIPYFIQVSKIAKNDDFLEIEIARNSLTLDVEDNILNFEENQQEETVVKNVSVEDIDDIVHTKPIKKIEIVPEPDVSKQTVQNTAEDVLPVQLPGLEPDEEIETLSASNVQPKSMPVAMPGVEQATYQVPATQPIAAGSIENAYQSVPNINQAQPLTTSAIPQIQQATIATPATPTIQVVTPQANPVQQVVTPVSAPQANVVNPTIYSQIEPVQENNGNGKHSVEGYESEIGDNDTLIISDTNKTVILPYKIVDLEKKMQKNKNYKTLKDVVDKEYTIPIDTFKNPVKSRFREAFQLIKKKEHGSLKEAVGLGFELMFQSNLNPAVIAACKDLDELDIYLDCLDDNELDKFSCFKISYAVPPSKH